MFAGGFDRRGSKTPFFFARTLNLEEAREIDFGGDVVLADSPDSFILSIVCKFSVVNGALFEGLSSAASACLDREGLREGDGGGIRARSATSAGCCC